MPLEETYPRLLDKITAARDAGYGDEEIQKHIQGKIQTAIQAGHPIDKVNEFLGEIPKPSIMEPIKGTARGVAETATSAVPAMVGGVLGGPLGAVGGAGVGETLRQLIFDDETKPETIAFAAATGWIPGLRFAGVTNPLARLGIKAGEGAVFNAVQGEGRKLIEEKGKYKFDPKETVYNSIVGALFGTAVEGMLPSLGKRLPKNAQDKISEISELLSNPDKVTEYVKSALGKDYKNLTQTEAMALTKAYQQNQPAAAAGDIIAPTLTTQQMHDLSIGAHTSESVARILGTQNTDVASALVKSGQLQRNSEGHYELAAAPPVAAPAAKPSAKAPMQINDTDFITRYSAGTPEQRAQMERGIRTDSPLWSQMQQAKREIQLKENPTAARQEIETMIGEAKSFTGPARDAAFERLRSMGIEPEGQALPGQTRKAASTITQEQADLPVRTAPSAQGMRQMELDRLSGLINDRSYSLQDRQEFQAQLTALTKDVHTSPKESPEVSRKVVQELERGLQEEAPVGVPEAGLTPEQRAMQQRAQTARTAPESTIAAPKPQEAVQPAEVLPAPQSVSEAAPVEAGPVQPLPKSLAGAKPRFYAGKHGEVDVTYARDLEKAALITAQAKKSKSDALYLKYVMDQTGLDEPGARALGQDVKDYINTNRTKGPGSKVGVPEIWQPPDVAMTKTAEPVTQPKAEALPETAAEMKYVDPLDRPLTKQERADWNAFVKENRLKENTLIRDMKQGLIPEMREKLKRAEKPGAKALAALSAKELPPETAPAAAAQPAPVQQEIKTIPDFMKRMPIAELTATLDSPTASTYAKDLARREVGERSKVADSMETPDLEFVANDKGASAPAREVAQKELARRTQAKAAAKPDSLDERIAALEAENAAIVKDLGLDEKSLIDLIKGSTTESGAIGHLTPEQQRAEMIARAHRVELLRRVKDAMTGGLDMAGAAAKLKIPYEAFDKMRRELLYPIEHFSWENIEPDVLRNRDKERATLARVYGEARKQNKPLSVIAAQQNIDPKELRNIVYETKVDDFLDTLGGSIRNAQKLNERSKFLLAEQPAIEQTGTIRPGSKQTAREDVRPDTDTYKRRISEIGFDTTRSQMLEAIKGFENLATEQRRLGTGMTAMKAAEMSRDAASWAKSYNTYADQWFKDRAAWGRIGKAQQRPPIPADLIDFMKQSGAELQLWRNHPERTPIYTSLWEARNWNSLTPSEKFQTQNNAVDAVRLNLFPLTSWTLDTILNAAELTTQITSAAGADIGYALRTGKVTAPNLRGIKYAAANAFSDVRNRIYAPEFEEAIGFTAGGEPIPGSVRVRDLLQKPSAENYWLDFFKTGKQGAFTRRENQGSAALDTLTGTPMYMKGAVDSAFKRFAGSMSIYADALKAADAAGVNLPLERKLFVKDYWSKLPKDSLDRAIEVANAAGFNRQLPQFVERMSRSKPMQLFVDAFGRFSWQFLRWTGDMLGADPKIWRKISAGVKEGRWGLDPEETMRYLARVATGVGGLALIDSHFYDKTDFNSLEKVDEDGNRMRLAGREPIASALFLSALARGDWDKASGAARYTSFPFLKMLYGEGGLVSSMLRESALGKARGESLVSKQVSDEFVDLVNKAIPGQAILSALKSSFDTEVREGVGANLPGVSLFKDPKIDLTTGEPVEVTQHFPGTPSMRTIAGTPIPGFVRELNPVTQMLSRYGLMTYRANRLPIAGVSPDDAPPEMNRQWQIEFGRMRDQLQSKLVPAITKLEARATPDQLVPKAPLYEAIRAKIKTYDAMAARYASQKINSQTRTPMKLPRELSAREKRLPTER